MPIQNPWRHQVVQLVNRGLDLIHPIDEIDAEHFARLTNVESVFEGEIQPRPGTSLINSSAIVGGVGAGGFDPPSQTDTNDGGDWIKVTSAAPANTYGSYQELIASTAFAGTWVSLSLISAQGAIGLDNRFDLAIGAAGSEVDFVTEMTYRYQVSGVDSTTSMDISFPFTVASGSRISARIKDDDTSTRAVEFLIHIHG